MKNLKLKSIGMLLVVVLLSVNSNIFAQKGNGNGRGIGQFNESCQGYFCNNIPNLTTDQQTKIDELRTSHWKEMQNSHNQLTEKRARLQTLRTADNADVNAINEAIDAISIIQTSMQKNQEKHFQDVRNLLTDDQKAYYDNSNRSRGNGQYYGGGNYKFRGNGCGRGNGPCKRNW